MKKSIFRFGLVIFNTKNATMHDEFFDTSHRRNKNPHGKGGQCGLACWRFFWNRQHKLCTENRTELCVGATFLRGQARFNVSSILTVHTVPCGCSMVFEGQKQNYHTFPSLSQLHGWKIPFFLKSRTFSSSLKRDISWLLLSCQFDHHYCSCALGPRGIK